MRPTKVYQPPFTTRPELRGTFGAIASTHWLASAVGMAVLERGGNAFDAAAAAGFVFQIVEPHLHGPGGEVPIILKRADADARSAGRRGRFGEATIDALRRRGHKVTVEGPWALGRVCAVGREGDKLSAAATPRIMQAYAIAR